MQDTTAANITATFEQVGFPAEATAHARPDHPHRIGGGYRDLDEHVVAVEDRSAAAFAGTAHAVARLSGLPGRPRRGARDGDRRVRLNAGRVKGGTVISLTRQPDGARAARITIPTSRATLERRTHGGHEWIDVLSGHTRVVLGDHELVLASGDVV